MSEALQQYRSFIRFSGGLLSAAPRYMEHVRLRSFRAAMECWGKAWAAGCSTAAPWEAPCCFPLAQGRSRLPFHRSIFTAAHPEIPVRVSEMSHYSWAASFWVFWGVTVLQVWSWLPSVNCAGTSFQVLPWLSTFKTRKQEIDFEETQPSISIYIIYRQMGLPSKDILGFAWISLCS